MRKAREKIVLACLKDYNIEDIYEHHVNSFCIGKRKASRASIIPKYQYLIHLIITKCKWSDKGECHLHTQFYRDSIFHDHYNEMLLNLSYMGLIHIGGYSVGKYSTTISLANWNIDYITSYNEDIIKWSKMKYKNLRNIKKFEETPFIKKYTESLSCLRLVRKDEALSLIDRTITDKQTQKYHHYKTFIEDFNEDELRIYRIDEQNRIYHILTSLPKILREFYNIKYELDIGNSHPLLLNHFLIKYYNIDIKIIKGYLYNNHYDVDVIHKSLIDNNIDVPKDVIQYMFKTTQGRFYDDFIEEFGDIERSEVKHKVFSQVFYSHITETYVTKFRMAFIDKYPNVWKAIKGFKIESNDRFPHLMMRFESRLFKEILSICWEKGYRVINLHDALILFDVEDNKNVGEEDLKSIIKNVYRKYCLYPTVKTEIDNTIRHNPTA